MHFLTTPGEALVALAQLPACVLVVDWHMPEMNGPALCRKVRELLHSDSSRHVYLILLTGMDGPERAAEALESGADDFVSKPIQIRELIARIRVGWRLVAAQHQLAVLNNQLARLATTDPLTGLYNRRAAEDALDKEIARVERGLNALTVCIVDLDHFKQINDTHGHAAGDEVLQAVSRTLMSSQRPYDRSARWGGEEFLVICPDYDQSGGLRIGERICGAISSTPILLPTQNELSITASVGVASLAAGISIDRSTLIEFADQELYRAKEAGRDRAHFRAIAEYGVTTRPESRRTKG